MDVQVKVATVLLKKAAPPLQGSDFTFRVEPGTDVAGLIRELGLPPELVGSVMVNKRRCPRERLLEAGDRVAIVPSISGG